MRIRVKNEKNSLVIIETTGRQISLPKGKEIDLVVETNDAKEVTGPEDVVAKIDSGEITVIDWCDCKKPDSSSERKRRPEPITEPAEDRPAPKPRTAKKATAAEPITEPAEDGDAKNPLADLPKIV